MRTDEELIAAAASGEAEAFGLFYRRHVAAITTFLRRRVHSPETAFDLAAETFASAAAGLGGYEPRRGTPRGWLFGIATNELNQAWRKGRVEDRARRRLALEPIVLDDEALTRIEETIDDGALVRALSDLPEAERQAIEARVLKERDYADAARELKCSEAVVRQRVSRGLRKIRASAKEAT
jgi:RNA polymerase sigma factor (sigma-70 family)